MKLSYLPSHVCPSKTLYTLAVHVCTHLLQQHVESGWFVIFSQLPMHPLPKMPLFPPVLCESMHLICDDTHHQGCLQCNAYIVFLVAVNKTQLLDKLGMGGMTYFTYKGINSVPW